MGPHQPEGIAKGGIPMKSTPSRRSNQQPFLKGLRGVTWAFYRGDTKRGDEFEDGAHDSMQITLSVALASMIGTSISSFARP